MKTLLKDSLREIKKSFGRFISILLIVGLGVGFFSGIKATAPDMKMTGDKYFDDYNLMDYWLLSTMGFEEKDKEELLNLQGIEKVMASYSMDALIEIDGKDSVLKLMSLPQGYKNSLNIPVLVEGRLPENEGECVLEARSDYMEKFEIGSRITLKSGNEDELTENLKNESYTVVGFANSPLHITRERDSSKIGNGKIESFLILPEEEFKSEYYTDMYLGIGEELDSFSQDYKDKLDKIKIEVEELGERRRTERLDEIKVELNEKLLEGKGELEKEKSDGEKKLEDAKLELENAKRELENAKHELDTGRREISNGEKAISDGEKTLNKEIEDNSRKLDDEEEKLNKATIEFEEQLAKFNEEKVMAEEKLNESQKIINENEAKLVEGENGLKELEETIVGLKAQLETIENEEEKVVIEGNIKELELKYNGSKEEISKGREELNIAKNELEKGRQELVNGENLLNETKLQLDNGKNEISRGREELIRQKTIGENRLNEERRKLEKAKSDVAQGFIKIEDGEKEILDGEINYEKGLKEFNDEIEKANRDLKKLEREINDLEKPDWFIVKRTDTRNYNEFEMGADRIDSVAKVFPVFFLLIALLVVLTTMTRMVDEQRSYIGILKALGYTNMAIMSKYLIYGLVASLAGSVLGLLIGFKVLPTVIFNAYRILFIMPPVIVDFNILYAWTTTLAAVLTTAIAVVLSVKNELGIVPAMLMRQKTPTAGKRIFLERITPIWSRLNFSKKVTARNVFRYKRRLFMTVVGIAGCTALLIAGFGIKDSIRDITNNQYVELSNYDMTVDINDGLIYKDKDPVIKFLKEDDRIESFNLGYNKLIDAKNKDIEEKLEIIAVENSDSIKDFINLKIRSTDSELELDDDSVILTEKMGNLLDIKAGDNITLIIDDNEYVFKVKDLTENYAFHYVYMTEAYYEKIVGKDIEYNKIYAKTQEGDIEFRDNLSKDLLGVEDVSSVTFITDMIKSLNDTMDSLDTVIIVIIIAAGVLAFIVLYNLTNINVSERMRELATIKVLGFYDNEVSKYVYRENNILTGIGIFFGLIAGIFLHKFVILTVEIDMIMFGRHVRPISFVYATVFTILFSLLVNFVVHFKLKKIDMVESMKSVD